MHDFEEHGTISVIGQMHFWIIFATAITAITLAMVMKPVWLGFEREAFVESHQYVESHKDKLMTDIEEYDGLEAQIRIYEESGSSRIVEGLRMQQSSLKKRIRASLAKIPEQHHPSNVGRFSK